MEGFFYELQSKNGTLLVAFKETKTMKKSLLFLALIISVQVARSQMAGVISTPTLIPAQPTVNDIVKIVTEVTTPNQAIVVDPCTANISGFNIFIKTCYSQVMLPATQTFVDTLTIGQLAAGSYTILQTVFNSTAQQHCAKIDSSMASSVFVVTTPQATSLHETEIESAWKVFPNPASSYVHIKSPVRISEVRIYSSTGALVKAAAIDKSGQLNVSDLSEGVYFLKLSTAGETKTLRFVKHN